MIHMSIDVTKYAAKMQTQTESSNTLKNLMGDRGSINFFFIILKPIGWMNGIVKSTTSARGSVTTIPPIAKMGLFENYIHLVDVNDLTTATFSRKIIQKCSKKSLSVSHLKVVWLERSEGPFLTWN